MEPVWLVQLSHIKASSLRKKIRLFAKARILGRKAAAEMRARTADASTLGDVVPVVPVTLGDQNLTQDEVSDNALSRSLIDFKFHIAASEGVMDRAGRLHQDLIVVDASPGVALVPSRSAVFSCDGFHQAVRAHIYCEPSVQERLVSAKPPPKR